MKKSIIVVLVLLFGVFFYACSHKPGQIIYITPADTSHQTTDSTQVEVIDTSVCFQRDVLPIFQSSCAKAGCHDAITRAEGYQLDTYPNIVSRGIVVFNGAKSTLYKVCLNKSMPQSPTPKLDSTQLYYIKHWIDMGAHNDTNCIVNCDTTKYTYSGAIAPMMQKYCNSCHSTASASSGGGVVLDTYSGVLAQALNGKLLGDMQHATGFNAMPKGGNKLSDCKVTQVAKWIKAGSLNN